MKGSVGVFFAFNLITDYYNSLCVGLCLRLNQNLQLIQNATAQILMETPPSIGSIYNQSSANCSDRL